MGRRKEKKAGSSIGVVLFGGVFAAIGIGMLLFAVLPTLAEGWQMQAWQPVQAQVIEVDLKRYHSDDGTTYRVTSTYRYRWQGQEYSSSRIGIGDGSDNIGDWQQQQYNQLQRAREDETAITVWIDPEAPYKAVVDRQIRWGLLGFYLVFVVGFGGAGLGIIFFGLRRNRVAESDTPWLLNEAWQGNTIQADSYGGVWFLWIFGGIWTLSTSLVLFNADSLDIQPDYPSFFLYVFPSIGLLILFAALIKTRRWRRFGTSALSLSPFPGEVGGRIAGQITLSRGASDLKQVQVTLSCVHVYWSGSGKNRSRHEDVLWQDSREIGVLPGGSGGRIPFEFVSHSDLPESSDGGDYHKWVLKAGAKLAGPDLEQSFTIPVFAVEHHRLATPGERDEVEAASASVGSTPSRKSPPSAGSLPTWLELGYRAGGLTLFLPSYRNKAIAVPLMIVGTIFAVAGLFAMQFEEVPLMFGLIFIVVGGGVLVSGIYSLVNTLEVVVASRGVRMTRRFFGQVKQHAVDVQQIRAVEKRITSQSGNSAFYRVYLTTHDGKQWTLADSLPSVSSADYLIGQFRQQLRLDAA